MADRPVRVGLAGDDEAHRILMQRLADEATTDVRDRDARRRWVRHDNDATFLQTGKRPAPETVPSGRQPYRSQRFDGKPLGYATVFVEAAEALHACSDIALVLVDEDGKESRVPSAIVAREYLRRFDKAPPVVFGVCDPCAEGWLVALIGPTRPKRLAALSSSAKVKLPSQTEHLTSHGDNTKNAKRGLHFLLDDRRKKVSDYPISTPGVDDTEPVLAASPTAPAHLKSLTGCGLASFYQQLVDVYAPMVNG